MDNLKFTNVIGWQKNSFIDFKRTVATVLFFSGCNLRCPYCHNKDIVENKLPAISSDEFWSFLDRRKDMIEGVVLTGGEPTIHSNLKDIICEIKARGFKVKLDTNGLLPKVLSNVIEHIDYIALDVKTWPQLYKKLLDYKLNDAQESIKETIDILKSFKKDFEIRITAVPTILDKIDCFTIGSFLNDDIQVYLQKFRNTNTMNPLFQNAEPFSIEEMNKFKQILLTYTNKCEIR